MKAIVVTEERFSRDAAGALWSVAAGDAFWERYLRVFSSVRVLARVAERADPPAGAARVSDPRVVLCPVPDYVGPRGLGRALPGLVAAAGRCCAEDGAFILRAPGFLSIIMGSLLTLARKPFAVEAVGFAIETFTPNAFPARLRPMLASAGEGAMARLCRRAVAVAYVTERELQSRYPAARGAFTTSYSSIELPPSLLVAEAPPARADPPFDLVSVGSMEQLYKGFDTLLQALAELRAAGLPCRLTLAGSGRCRPELEALAERLGLGAAVRFAGHLPRSEVLALVDAADLFVLASRHEGLPRAVIEAMARGKPCLGTRAGGIPELLEPEDLVPVEDAGALARAIAAVLRDPVRRQAMAGRNLHKARRYGAADLERRRSAFYRRVAERCGPGTRMPQCAPST